MNEPEVTLSSEFAQKLPELAVPWQSIEPQHPELLVVNEALAEQLALSPEWLRSERGIRFLLGNSLPHGANPVAQAYSGHQFGVFNPHLGDGRALLLGELTDRSGRLRDLHLKGSGPTSFARADGYAAAGAMLREHLMGEAMYALGVPTTRALAVVATGQKLARDESIDLVPGAVLVRTAASHLRVGSFQYVAARNDVQLLRRLADYAISRHFTELTTSEAPYLGLLRGVIRGQAKLVASWMLTGFVHGVMNTDNMTISGETIDYGPCAFIDAYDPGAVFSSIDREGRYAYGNQPNIALWNLTRFAETLLPLLHDDPEAAKELAVEALSEFSAELDANWVSGFRAKLGLSAVNLDLLSQENLIKLMAQLLGDLQTQRIDFTQFFRVLAEAASGDDARLTELFAASETPLHDREWFRTWLALSPDWGEMDRVNPVVIPRNHLVDEALDAANAGDMEPYRQLLEQVSRPFDERPAADRYTLPAPPELGRHVTYCGT